MSDPMSLPAYFSDPTDQEPAHNRLAVAVAEANAAAATAFVQALPATGLAPEELLAWLNSQPTQLRKSARKVARLLLLLANLDPTPPEVMVKLRQEREARYGVALAQDNGLNGPAYTEADAAAQAEVTKPSRKRTAK